MASEGHVRGYISARETIDAARARGLSICDYLESIWSQQGDTRRIIDMMRELGVFRSQPDVICEIGTGSGRYAEKVLQLHRPALYESYEPDRGWAAWLAHSHGVVSHPVDGRTLRHTRSGSVNLLHAHGVFVYLPFVTSCGYLLEIGRVTAPGGFAVFDIMSEACFDDATLMRWLKSGDCYPSFLSKEFVLQRMAAHGLALIGEFFTRIGCGRSHYLAFEKREA